MGSEICTDVEKSPRFYMKSRKYELLRKLSQYILKKNRALKLTHVVLG